MAALIKFTKCAFLLQFTCKRPFIYRNVQQQVQNRRTKISNMSAKPIREASGKDILNRNLPRELGAAFCRFATVDEETEWSKLIEQNPWLSTEMLVVKPDQLIKRRGKLGLMMVNKSLPEVKQWIDAHMNKSVKIGPVSGPLKTFIIEPFLPHKQEEELYVCILSERLADIILFYHEGGVNVGDVDAKAQRLKVPVGKDSEVTPESIMTKLLPKVTNKKKRENIAKFISALYKLYVDLYFTYLEINPLVVTDTSIGILDLAAKLDMTASFLSLHKWGDVDCPLPFGREALPEEAFISDLDARSGASLKFTVINKKGRIWTLVAGGGASVIYADTICDLGGTEELANYGEYSGAPTEQQTYDYAKTILGLMTDGPVHPKGKVLLIGGGIANFTNVASTFKGIIRALNEYQTKLKEHKVTIFVRRAGPNYQEGLKRMRKLGQSLGVPIHVFGPETHMTAICGMALGTKPIATQKSVDTAGGNFFVTSADVATYTTEKLATTATPKDEHASGEYRPLFTPTTKAMVWGMQRNAVQVMLDYDFICRRKEPSTVAMVYPFTGDHKLKFYWGQSEILIPVYKDMKDAMLKHPDADVMVSFASMRSAYQSCVETMSYPQIKVLAIIAEGIPENLTRKLIVMAKENNVTIIGPATVGGLKAECFKIGNTGGMMDNIIQSKLYRQGSVAYVSRSGGMSNELNNIISNASDGVYEGIAIGGDRYPGSTFMDHLLRYEADPKIKLLIVLGEVGGREEYAICEALKTKKITKPLIAWCIGTCATLFKTSVQFGHAGSSAGSDAETAVAKNRALKAAGAKVPTTFDDLGDEINKAYLELVKSGIIVPRPEIPPPSIPMEYSWARELGLIRKHASFMTSVSDERGHELLYGGVPISEVLNNNLGIGGVVSLLWFQKILPPYACKFFEMCLMITADHGPAVSGAHNTIVCTRAGKDLVASLVSGLLTIGDKFGGALNGAAQQFTQAYDSGLHPVEFVNIMRKKGLLIMGIGHRVKSINNPDIRVEIMKKQILKTFPSTPLLNYALEVEKITTSKKPNLILNVDGIIGIAFVDLMRNCGHFTPEEAQEYIDIGAINSLFVLGRTIGFIGHFMDQKRLKQGLYRHPWDDISYVLPAHMKH